MRWLLGLGLLAGLALNQPGLAQTAAPARPSAPPPAAVARPSPPVATPAAPASATGALPLSATRRIDVNGASEADLASLPGVGPATAKNIVQGRPWDDLNALVSKKAMNGPTFAKNKDRLALANINTSSAAEMAKTLPGIGDVRARKIAEGRPYATPADLVSKGALTQGQLDKIKDLITY